MDNSVGGGIGHNKTINGQQEQVIGNVGGEIMSAEGGVMADIGGGRADTSKFRHNGQCQENETPSNLNIIHATLSSSSSLSSSLDYTGITCPPPDPTTPEEWEKFNAYWSDENAENRELWEKLSLEQQKMLLMKNQQQQQDLQQHLQHVNQHHQQHSQPQHQQQQQQQQQHHYHQQVYQNSTEMDNNGFITAPENNVNQCGIGIIGDHDGAEPLSTLLDDEWSDDEWGSECSNCYESFGSGDYCQHCNAKWKRTCSNCGKIFGLSDNCQYCRAHYGLFNSTTGEYAKRYGVDYQELLRQISREYLNNHGVTVDDVSDALTRHFGLEIITDDMRAVITDRLSNLADGKVSVKLITKEELFARVDCEFIEADIFSTTVIAINNSVASHFGLKKLPYDMRVAVRSRLSDLVNNRVQPERVLRRRSRRIANSSSDTSSLDATASSAMSSFKNSTRKRKRSKDENIVTLDASPPEQKHNVPMKSTEEDEKDGNIGSESNTIAATNKIVTLYRLLSNDDVENLETKGSILAKDPTSDIRVLDHCLDGSLRSKYISCSTSPKRISYLAYKAEKSKRDNMSGILVSIRLPVDRLIDLSGTTTISDETRREHGIHLNAKAMEGCSFFSEVLVVGQIEESCIFHRTTLDFSSWPGDLSSYTLFRRYQSSGEVQSTTSSNLTKDDIISFIQGEGESLEDDPSSPTHFLPLEAQTALHDLINAHNDVEATWNLPPPKRAVTLKEFDQGGPCTQVLVGIHTLQDRCYFKDYCHYKFCVRRGAKPNPDWCSFHVFCATEALKEAVSDKECVKRLKALLTQDEHWTQCIVRGGAGTRYACRIAQKFYSSYSSIKSLLADMPLTISEYWNVICLSIAAVCPTTNSGKSTYLPCFCGDSACNEMAEMKNKNGEYSSTHSIHRKCATRELNLRTCAVTANKVFDWNAVDLVSENKQSEIGKLFFHETTGGLRQAALLIGPLIGTSFGYHLMCIREQQLKQLNSANYGVTVKARRNANQRRRMLRLRADMTMSALDNLASCENDLLSKDNIKRMLEEVEQRINDFQSKYGMLPHLFVFDSRANADGLGFHRNEHLAWLVSTNRNNCLQCCDANNVLSRFQTGDVTSFDEYVRRSSRNRIAVQIEFVQKSNCGSTSRDLETFLIRYLKSKYPGRTLNQIEIGPNTDLAAFRSNVDNSRRKTGVAFIMLQDKLDKGEAKLNIFRDEDRERLGQYYGDETFV